MTPGPASGHQCGKVGKCQYIDGAVGGGRLVLVDTGEVMVRKERKDFNIETMEDKFVSVETMKSIVMGLAVSMYLVVLYISFGPVSHFACK